MPTLEENKQFWDGAYDWKQSGDDWSSAWGGAHMQWYATLLPRIHRYLPADTVLEIAPGFGRWTQFLKDVCNRLILVDVSERCIQACRARFAPHSRLDYHVNDGKSLDFLTDESIDFVFSFDSLVHAEDDVMEAYLAQLARKLKRDGVGVVHHSNLGEYAHYYAMVGRIPRGKHFLERIGLIERIDSHWRALSMTAEKFRRYAERAGLHCLSQEIINWDSRRLIDCISVFSRPGSSWSRPTIVVRNPDFMRAAKYASMLAGVYETAAGKSPSDGDSGR